MKKWVALAVITVGVLIVASCGYQEGIRQPDRQSYIWFSGKTEGAVATVDDHEPFYVEQISDESATNNGRILYQVAPGKHEIIVKKDGQVVVHRQLIIGAGTTMEVRVP